MSDLPSETRSAFLLWERWTLGQLHRYFIQHHGQRYKYLVQHHRTVTQTWFSTIGQLTLYPSSRTMGSVHSNSWTPNVTAWFLNQSFFQKQSLSYTIVKRHGQKRKFLIECHGCRPICLEWEQWTVIQLVDLEHWQLTHYPWSRTKESDAQFLI